MLFRSPVKDSRFQAEQLQLHLGSYQLFGYELRKPQRPVKVTVNGSVVTVS